MIEDDEGADKSHECVVPDWSLPAKELSRYSPRRDPDAEAEIARYVEIETRDEKVENCELVKVEYIFRIAYEVWDVTTDKNKWWVITNLTNLYLKDHFQSLDYTLSFHIGLMARIQNKQKSVDRDNPDPFNEVFRRQDQAKNTYESANEVQDYQSIGLMLRECLITLTLTIQRRTTFEFPGEQPKQADFVSWSSVVIEHFCSDSANKKLRQYLRSVSKETWKLVNWLTHDRNANQLSSSIAIEAVDVIVGHFMWIVVDNRLDSTHTCPTCRSRMIRSHFDPKIPPDGDYYSTCAACNWTNHPSA